MKNSLCKVLCAAVVLVAVIALAQSPFSSPAGSSTPFAGFDNEDAAGTSGTGPTTGFHLIPDHYSVQRPYDLQVADRFSTVDGVCTCWVFGHDKPHEPDSHTGPRTEMRWETWPQQDHENQFEFDARFDDKTTKTCIFQIKSNSGGREALYLQVHGPGELRNSTGPVFLQNMANKWFHVNASFNPATGDRHLWIDGKLLVSGTYNSPVRDWYFKCGTYSNGIAPDDRSWAEFKNFKHWVK